MFVGCKYGCIFVVYSISPILFRSCHVSCLFLFFFCFFIVSLKIHAVIHTQRDYIKKWKKCVELVQQAQRQYQEHLQFKSLLAECDREASIGGHAVASTSNAGAASRISLLVLRRKMAVRVRSKLIEKARVALEIVGALQDERVKLKLMQQHNQLAQTDQGWKLAWGIVDRALAGMKCFCGTFHILSPAPTTT